MRLSVLCLVLCVSTSAVLAQPFAERLPTCLGCHGAAGQSELDGVPSLGGQPADYVLLQLYLFREKQRVADPMNAMAEGLTDDELRAAGDTIAKLPPPVTPADAVDQTTLQQGAALVAQYHCGSCHNPDFAGHEQIPRLADQREDYLAKSLAAFKSNARAGYDPAMNEAAQEVRDADIPVIAKYLAHFRS
jgi:cytochrome c553